MTFWVAGAAVVGGIASSAISSDAASSAANTQAAGARNAQDISQRQFNLINSQEQPFLNAGQDAQSQLNYLTGIGTPGGYNTAGSSQAGGYGSLVSPFTADTFKQYSPAYQFQLQQGQQGVLNADTSGQGALSGAAQKDLMNYNQGLAGTSFNNAFNQYQTQQGNIYSRLSDIANRGQSAASQTAQSGTALAGQAAQSATNVGSALGAGQIGAGNAWSGGVSSLGGLLASYGGGGPSSSQWGGSAPVQGTPYGSGANSGTSYCDYALKCDIRRVGIDGVSALPVYDFWYIDQAQTEPKWRGYIAQEVQTLYPDAVSCGPNGFLKVDYRQIPSEHAYPLLVDGVF